jgi:tRNA threonylcarbamoyladenosine biosynthesis protein TsaB
MPTLPEHRAAPCVLALDSSTEQLAVALHAAGASFCVNAEGGAAASGTLLPHINALLARAGMRMADLQAVAVGRGPGAFTGVRTACAVAQGLGLGLSCPLLPIDSLLIVAEDARMQAGCTSDEWNIGVAMDARMDEAYAGCYRWEQGCWQVLQAPALFTLAALGQAWAGAGLHAVSGSALGAFGARVAWPPGVPRWPGQSDRAAALLRLALQAHGAGVGVDAAQALPLYLRDRVALTTQEREAARARPAATHAT